MTLVVIWKYLSQLSIVCSTDFLKCNFTSSQFHNSLTFVFHIIFLKCQTHSNRLLYHFIRIITHTVVFIVCETSVCLIKTGNIAAMSIENCLRFTLSHPSSFHSPFVSSVPLLHLLIGPLIMFCSASARFMLDETYYEPVCIRSLRDYLALERLDALYLSSSLRQQSIISCIFSLFNILLFICTACCTSSPK